MRILVTNDDGVEAPGLAILQQIALELSDDVWVTAPATEQSGAAHSLTLHEPLRIRKLAERTYAVKGTPTDCVIMAVGHILTDKKPDLVLSGVNRGQNAADDVTYSGTIAGAIEGTMLGVPSIALSQAYDFENPATLTWEAAMAHGAPLIRRLLAAGWPPDVLLNVNFPGGSANDVRGVAVTEQGMRRQDAIRIETRLDTRGSPYYWLGGTKRSDPPREGADLWAIAEGFISVTPLSLDLTHRETCKKLKESLDS